MESLRAHGDGGSSVKTPAWDLRAAICKAGAEELQAVDDDALMFLLLEAVYPSDIDKIFSELYSRYQPRVAAWCRRLIRDPHSVEDMTQEIFLRAYRYRFSFRGEARTSTWLFTVTRNYCLTAIRKRGGEPSSDAAQLSPRLQGDSGHEIQRQMETSEAFEEIWRLINTRLSVCEARVMVLHYGHELPLALITRQLGLTNPSGAKAYIVNAKRKLSAVLNRSSRRTKDAIAA